MEKLELLPTISFIKQPYIKVSFQLVIRRPYLFDQQRQVGSVKTMMTNIMLMIHMHHKRAIAVKNTFIQTKADDTFY